MGESGRCLDRAHVRQFPTKGVVYPVALTDMTNIAESTLADAWEQLSSDPTATLIDVRTEAEWQWVGVPDLSSIGKEARMSQWITWPGGAPNPDFMAQASADLDKDQPILFLCRSGARSHAAAQAFQAAGFTNVTNVSAGFEGDHDTEGHRHGGWKDELPWRQS